MLSQLFSALFTVIIGVGGCVGYFYGSNWLLDHLLPAERDGAGLQDRKATPEEIETVIDGIDVNFLVAEPNLRN